MAPLLHPENELGNIQRSGCRTDHRRGNGVGRTGFPSIRWAGSADLVSEIYIQTLKSIEIRHFGRELIIPSHRLKDGVDRADEGVPIAFVISVRRSRGLVANKLRDAKALVCAREKQGSYENVKSGIARGNPPKLACNLYELRIPTVGEHTGSLEGFLLIRVITQHNVQADVHALEPLQIICWSNSSEVHFNMTCMANMPIIRLESGIELQLKTQILISNINQLCLLKILSCVLNLEEVEELEA